MHTLEYELVYPHETRRSHTRERITDPGITVKSSAPLVTLMFVTTAASTMDVLMHGQMRYFRKMGFNVMGVCSPGNETGRISIREGVAVREVAMSRRPSPMIDVVSLVRLARLFRKEKPTIVHSSTPKAGVLGMLAATLVRVPVRFYTVRGMASHINTATPAHMIRMLEKTACHCASQVLAVSRSVADAMIGTGLCPSHKMKVLHHGSSNGVDADGMFTPDAVAPDQVRALRHRLQIPADAYVIGFVGRVVKDKGFVELAQAWQEIKRVRPNGRLIVVGPPERDDAVPESFVKGLMEDPSVIITGMVSKEEMPSYYKMMNVVSFPSYREGFPNVVLEAAAMEVPVVATRVTGCVDAVIHGVTGALIPPRDTKALKDALIDYLDDPALARRHGQAARNRVLKDFRPQDVWEALLNEYVRVLEQNGLPVPDRATVH